MLIAWDRGHFSLIKRALLVIKRAWLLDADWQSTPALNWFPASSGVWKGISNLRSGVPFMAFHPRQNSMLYFTFYFWHFILHLLFDIWVYTFVIQLSSCNILLFACYPTFVVSIHFGHSTFLVQHLSFCLVHSPFRTQYSSSRSSSAGCTFRFSHSILSIWLKVFAFNIWLYVFHLQVCIVHSTFKIVLLSAGHTPMVIVGSTDPAHPR